MAKMTRVWKQCPEITSPVSDTSHMDLQLKLPFIKWLGVLRKEEPPLLFVGADQVRLGILPVLWDFVITGPGKQCILFSY